MTIKESPATKLVDAEGLLEALFDERSRPSVRWLRRMQDKRVIPFVRIGRLVRFDIGRVQQALDEKLTVKSRS